MAAPNVEFCWNSTVSALLHESLPFNTQVHQCPQIIPQWDSLSANFADRGLIRIQQIGKGCSAQLRLTAEAKDLPLCLFPAAV